MSAAASDGCSVSSADPKPAAIACRRVDDIDTDITPPREEEMMLVGIRRATCKGPMDPPEIHPAHGATSNANRTKGTNRTFSTIFAKFTSPT